MQSTGADQHRSWSGGDQETFAWGGEPSTKADVGDELWVPVPPGWIELAAHPDDASADEWFADLLDATPGLGHEDAASLAATFAHVRAALSPTPVDAAGVLLTVLDDHPTLWQFSLTLVAGPPSGDVDPMAVVERFLGSASGRSPLQPDDLVESFDTPDGRSGVAVHTSAPVPDPDDLRARLPAARDRFGVVHAAVRMSRAAGDDRDRLLLVTGLSPTVEERLPMAIGAAQLTLGARLHDSDRDALPGRVHLDATGRRGDRPRDQEEPRA